MDKLDRMTDLYRTLSVRRTPIALRDLMRELECSESTVRRALCKLRDEGLLQHRRIRITYRSRSRDQISGRTLSPQRLTWYRSNWYLDAWCHEREALRCFALERLTAATLLETPAHDVLSADLDAHFADAYGIFTGPATQTATLIFSRERARWVADEEWHPHQQGRHLPDGRYELTLPYGRADELIMDILKYGPDVEVTAPAELRDAIADRLEEAAARYRRLVRF